MRNRSRAQSLVEITVGIAVFVPVFLTLLDLSLIFFAVQQNEAMCRNTVEAAATGVPSQAADRARVIVNSQNGQRLGGFIPAFRLVGPVQTQVLSGPRVAHDLIADKFYSAGGPIVGTATATTEVSVNTFIVHVLYSGKRPIAFRSTKSYPIKYVAPRSSSPETSAALP